MTSPERETVLVGCHHCGEVVSLQDSQINENRCTRCNEKLESSFGDSNLDGTFSIDVARKLWQTSVAQDADPSLTIRPTNCNPTFFSVEAGQTIKPAGIDGVAPQLTNIPIRQIGRGSAGDFELNDPIGYGGMGVVYRSKQASLQRDVAVKMLKKDIRSDAEKSDFLHEAMVTGFLEHPNIVPVYDVGRTPDGILFYSMKEVKGTNWKDAMMENTEEQNLEILQNVCDAIAYAHSKGIIHRDLKPANVMIGDYGEIYVLDWGLAAKVDKQTGIIDNSTGSYGKQAGTPAYMAPEMAACNYKKIGITSDIYLLGGLLFEIATGLPPHDGGDLFGTLYHAMENKIQQTRAASVLVKIALKAMSSRTEERHSSVKEFQKDLKQGINNRVSVKSLRKVQAKLSDAKESRRYADFEAAFDYLRKAMENPEDEKDVVLAQNQLFCEYAYEAFERGDSDLAKSFVGESWLEEYIKFQKIKQKHLVNDHQREVVFQQQIHYQSEKFLYALIAIVLLVAIIMFLVLGIALLLTDNNKLKNKLDTFAYSKPIASDCRVRAFRMLQSTKDLRG